MGMSRREKASFGWLGAPPARIADASADTVAAWKALAREAAAVTRMPSGYMRTQMAKNIGEKRDVLIARIKEETDGKA